MLHLQSHRKRPYLQSSNRWLLKLKKPHPYLRIHNQELANSSRPIRQDHKRSLVLQALVKYHLTNQIKIATLWWLKESHYHQRVLQLLFLNFVERRLKILEELEADLLAKSNRNYRILKCSKIKCHINRCRCGNLLTEALKLMRQYCVFQATINFSIAKKVWIKSRVKENKSLKLRPLLKARKL